MPPSTKKTYGTQRSSSPASHLDSSPAPSKRKRPLIDQLSFDNAPPRKKQQLSSKPKPKVGKSASKATAKGKDKGKQKQLTQLHFCLDTPILRTCPLCNLSYTRGAPDDEILHKSHCARVQRGLEWGKEEAREITKAGVEEVASSIKLNNGSKGRIIRFRADVGGKIGAKVRQNLSYDEYMMNEFMSLSSHYSSKRSTSPYLLPHLHLRHSKHLKSISFSWLSPH